MSRLPSRIAAALLLFLLGCSCGCSYFPEFLQPHELQKLNRGAGPSTDPFYSAVDKNRSVKIIPTSHDRPPLVNNRPQFQGPYRID